MLRIQNLCVEYPDKKVLRNVCMKAEAGEVTVLLGPNGCGKSTLLKTVCGILQKSNGEAVLNGENVFTLSRAELARKITYLAQSRQVPDITVRRLVLHGRFPYLSYPRRYRAEDYSAAEAAIAQMGISDLAEKPMEQLSGGQRQKAYIAMALAQDTPVVLLDEPTTYLDISHQLQLIRQARTLAEQSKTVLMVVHDLDQAMNAADNIVVLHEGCVVTQGTPEEIYQSGKLETVFGIRLNRVKTNKGWHYYYEEQ